MFCRSRRDCGNREAEFSNRFCFMFAFCRSRRDCGNREAADCSFLKLGNKKAAVAATAAIVRRSLQ